MEPIGSLLRDFRVFVINDKVIAAMEKKGRVGFTMLLKVEYVEELFQIIFEEINEFSQQEQSG